MKKHSDHASVLCRIYEQEFPCSAISLTCNSHMKTSSKQFLTDLFQQTERIQPNSIVLDAVQSTCHNFRHSQPGERLRDPHDGNGNADHGFSFVLVQLTSVLLINAHAP